MVHHVTLVIVSMIYQKFSGVAPMTKSQHWRVALASGGHPPRLYPLLGRLGFLLGSWSAPNKRNANEAKGIFCNAGCVLALALCPDPP